MGVEHLDIVQEQTVRQSDEEAASFQLNVTRKPGEKVLFVKSTFDGKVNEKVTNVFWILRREAILVAGGTVCFQGNQAEPACL